MTKTLLTLGFLIATVWGQTLYAQDAEETAEPTRYTIKIVSPKPDEVLQNSTQELPVTVEVLPPLGSEDMIVIYIDGQQAGEPSKDNTIITPWLPRGPHSAQAKIVQKGGPGAESEVVNFQQLRTSSSLPSNTTSSGTRAPTAPTAPAANKRTHAP